MHNPKISVSVSVSVSVKSEEMLFEKSPHSAATLNLARVRMPQRRFSSAAPVSRQSFSDKILLFSLVVALYTICSFELLLLCVVNRILARSNLLHR